MKVGIVGCGTIAHSHIKTVKEKIKNIDLLLCDTNKDRADDLGTEYNAKEIFYSIDDLLSGEKPDTVHILTPPRSHSSLAQKAIMAGCHALIEKPATETIKEFEDLTELARRKNKILCVNYSTLGMPVVVKAKELVSSGKLGRMVAVHCVYACSWPGNTIPYGNPAHWAYYLKGGVLQNWADHPASLILDFLGPIEDYKICYTRRNVLPNNCPDLLHVSVRSNDQIGSFTLSLGHGSTDIRAHLILEEGTIIVDIRKMLLACYRGKGPQNIIKRSLSGISEGYSLAGGVIKNGFKLIAKKLKREPGIFRIIDNFYKCINGEEELLVKYSTVAAVTRLLEKAWENISLNP